MALATYSDLQTAVATWLARSGDSTITSNVADFITLAESRIAYGSGDPLDADYTKPLRIRAMETALDVLIPGYLAAQTVAGTANAITLTNTAAVTAYTAGNGYEFTATASNSAATTVQVDSLSAISVVKGSANSALSGGEIVKGVTYHLYDDGSGTQLILLPERATIPLPSNYLAYRSGYIDVNPIQMVEYLPPSLMDRRYGFRETDTPKAFTIENDAVRFGPYPDQQYFWRCNYYKKFGALSSAANWLMTNKPDVYLWGSLLEASIFLGDDTASAKFLRLYRAACNALQSQDEADRHLGSDMRISWDGTPQWGG